VNRGSVDSAFETALRTRQLEKGSDDDGDRSRWSSRATRSSILATDPEGERMPNIGPMELIIVLVIALIVLGPKKLPEMGRSVGKGMREFKGALSTDPKFNDDYRSDDEEDDDEDDEDEPETAATGKSRAAAKT